MIGTRAEWEALPGVVELLPWDGTPGEVCLVVSPAWPYGLGVVESEDFPIGTRARIYMTPLAEMVLTFPGHDAPCEHHWHTPIHRLQGGWELAGMTRCTVCGISKFAWELTDPRVQIRAALDYIRSRYDGPFRVRGRGGPSTP